MKSVLLGSFVLLHTMLYAQSNGLRLRAVGIDVFKNLPLMASFPKMGIMAGQERIQYSNPFTLETFFQFSTRQPHHFNHIGVGYTQLNQQIASRLAQNLEGYFIKMGHEQHAQNTHFKSYAFWGYNLTLTYLKVQSQLSIRGQYFAHYQQSLPDESGLGAYLEMNGGYAFLVFGRLETRIVARAGLALSEVGSPNSSYLPGAGMRLWAYPLSPVGGITVQFFYLTKPTFK